MKVTFLWLEKQASRILSLPLYPELKDNQVGHVIEAVLIFSQHLRAIL